jgi:hypothetical protein
MKEITFPSKIPMLSGHGIDQVFFHGCKITGLTLQNLNLENWAPVDFHKVHLS